MFCCWEAKILRASRLDTLETCSTSNINFCICTTMLHGKNFHLIKNRKAVSGGQRISSAWRGFCPSFLLIRSKGRRSAKNCSQTQTQVGA
jgi:hypothetical protein